MPDSKLDRANRNRRALRILSFLSFTLAICLIILTIIMSNPSVQERWEYLWDSITSFFLSIEKFIGRYEKWLAVIIILILFCSKAFLPIVPFSVIFIGSGLVFSAPVAIILNLAGFALLVLINFKMGRRFGGGRAAKVLGRFDWLMSFMDFYGKGNPWMLFILRFIPFVPHGSVSKLYGASDMNTVKFVIISVVGFLPRLISWSLVGCNFTNPLTSQFFIPFIVLAFISGISSIIIDTYLKIKDS
ncbi:MAG: TVP38/TMEM64 family protein [Acutalibacteraceae bacterium]